MNHNDFLQLILPFKDKMFRLAKRLLVSNEEAEDATQEIMVKLWNKNDVLLNYINIEAFAMTITKNHCLDQLKSKRANNLSISHDNFENNQTNIDIKLENVDTLNWVKKIINQLPEQQKIIIQLREIEEYEFEQIAKILNMKETAVRVALSRARKAIKAAIENTHDYGTKRN